MAIPFCDAHEKGHARRIAVTSVTCLRMLLLFR